MEYDEAQEAAFAYDLSCPIAFFPFVRFLFSTKGDKNIKRLILFVQIPPNKISL